MINEERLVQTFLDLVRVDSPSGHEEAIGHELAARLAALGLSVERDASGNVFGWLEGEQAAGDWLLLCAHMDTVGQDRGITPVIAEGVIRSDGTTILGADDKSGLAIILEVLQVLKEGRSVAAPLPHCPLEVLFTVEEETNLGRPGRIDLARLRAREGLVLDSGGPIGTFVISAPSQDKLTVTVHGRAAHAGSEPEKGINAIRVAAEAIAAMPLGRIDEETVANIGVIEGGTATNIVPERVTMKGMARSRDDAKLQRQTAAMVRALEEAAARHGATLDIETARTYHSYRVAEDAPLRRRIEAAARRLGLEPQPTASGGGSDANIFHCAGIQSIPLSTGMADVHTKREHIAIADMVACARLLLEIVRQ
ncbi:MAG: M20/M25/M40 family metallo-hydrolase [Anaerolineae bacterium]|nr:M20/M25/M40 family metallo-hydrolase [Anaerolineae bacterium]